MNASGIARVLGGRKSGKGWIARCPAHEDAKASLSLRDGESGKILVKCFAGCAQGDVITALKARGLWPEIERREPTKAEREQQQRRRVEEIAAARWARATAAMAEMALEQTGSTDPQRGPLTDVYLICRIGGAAMIEEYRRWKKRHPKIAAALVEAGRRSEERRRKEAEAMLDGER